jgi:hypothetical protein
MRRRGPRCDSPGSVGNMSKLCPGVPVGAFGAPLAEDGPMKSLACAPAGSMDGETAGALEGAFGGSLPVHALNADRDP